MMSVVNKLRKREDAFDKKKEATILVRQSTMGKKEQLLFRNDNTPHSTRQSYALVGVSTLQW